MSAATCSFLSKKEHEKLPNPPHSNLQLATSLARFCSNHLKQAQKGWQEGPPCTSGSVATARDHGTLENVQKWQMWHRLPDLFTDDSKFTLSTCDRHERVWRHCRTGFAARYIFLVWQVCWWVVLGKDILGGLEWPLSPSLGWEHQTQWCSGFSVPSVAWCGWSTLAGPGWRRNCCHWLTCLFLRPESKWASWDLVNAFSITRSLRRPSRRWAMPLPGPNRSLEKQKGSLNSTISTTAVYRWCMLPSLLNIIKWMSNMVEL